MAFAIWSSLSSIERAINESKYEHVCHLQRDIEMSTSKFEFTFYNYLLDSCLQAYRADIGSISCEIFVITIFDLTASNLGLSSGSTSLCSLRWKLDERILSAESYRSVIFSMQRTNESRTGNRKKNHNETRETKKLGTYYEISVSLTRDHRVDPLYGGCGEKLSEKCI